LAARGSLHNPAPGPLCIVRMRIRPLALMILGFALTSQVALASSRPEQPQPDVVEHVKKAVVIIKSFDERNRLLFQGSGFFVAPDRIITNLHVVGMASRVEVETFCGRTFSVEGLRAIDPTRDLALIEASIPATFSTTTLQMSTASPLPGESIFVVSNPKGSSWQVSNGWALPEWEFQDFGAMLPFTAPVSRGSSGGPVVNLSGRVVGIATVSLKRASQFYLAIPSQSAIALRSRILRPFPLELTD
jgi:serine protease Do